MSRLSHSEIHMVHRIGWLRAAVLGANDGIVSTASLIVGVAAASTATSEVLIAGVAGLVAGAMSMAAGEYVSVSSQSDTEQADLAREQAELAGQPDYECEELTRIYMDRGVDADLARQVAIQLMAKDSLGAHARDELGISEITAARPIQAALTSAATFAAGASEIVSMTEGYTSPTRPVWTPVNTATGSIDNLASVASVTIATAGVLNVTGAAMLTNSTRGGTVGALVSATKYAAPKANMSHLSQRLRIAKMGEP